MVASMRRGRSGRRLLAVRTNERAAAALGHQRARRQDLRLRRVGGHRRPGRRAAGVPQGRHPLRQRVHQLHVDPRRGVVVHRRHRLPARPDLRGDAGARLARRPADRTRSSTASPGTSSSSAACSWSCSCCRTRTASPRSRSTSSRGSAARSRARMPRLAGAPTTVSSLELPPERARAGRATHPGGARPDASATAGSSPSTTSSFTVSPGRIVGLIGPNGAGKTSADRRRHRLHPDERAASALDGEELVGLSRHEAGPSRAQPLVPVAGAVRGRHRARQPAGRLRPARSRCRTSAISSSPAPAAARPGRGRDPRVPPRGRPAAPCAGPAVRAAASARHRPGRRHASPACCCSTSRPPGSATWRPPSWPAWCAAWPTTGASAVLVVEHDMNFVMNVCDEHRRPRLRPPDQRRAAERCARRPGRDRRLPGRDRGGGGRGPREGARASSESRASDTDGLRSRAGGL